MYMTEKDSTLSAFNYDTRIDHCWRSIFKIKTVSENSMLSYHHWLKQSWRSKMAIVWLKGAFLIITTVLHKKRLNIYQA